MDNIDKILKVFPDARLVTTYREPTEVVASSCKLTGTVFAMAADDIDWHDHGRYMRWRTGKMLKRNVELREQFAEKSDQFIDFPMDRMVREPMTCVAEIYAHFGIELTEPTRQKMVRFMEKRGRAARKPNVYDAADYGLDIDELWPELQYYRNFYGIEGSRERPEQ
jgi:hypothetical protein